MIKGQKPYEKFKEGKKLSYYQSILAQCYVCNGRDEGGIDCNGSSCPLYRFMPYRKDKVKKVKKVLSEKERQEIRERLKRARDVKNKVV